MTPWSKRALLTNLKSCSQISFIWIPEISAPTAPEIFSILIPIGLNRLALIWYSLKDKTRCLGSVI